MPDYPNRDDVARCLRATSVVPVQLTLDGREEPIPRLLSPSESVGRVPAHPAPLFAQEPFSHRVPGTLPMDTQPACSFCGARGPVIVWTEDDWPTATLRACETCAGPDEWHDPSADHER